MEKNVANNPKKVRYGFLDFLRGINLISMIIFHLCWDLQYMFDVNVPGYTGTLGRIWQRCICITFIALSGFTFSIKYRKSDNNFSVFIKSFRSFVTGLFARFKRGIIVSLCGIIITFVTNVFMPENTVRFGILTFIGFAMIFCEMFQSFLQRRNAPFSIFFCLLFYVMTSKVSSHLLQLPLIFKTVLPTLWYANDFTAFLGFPPKEFMSTDYFPVFPWIFMYLIGYFMGKLFKENDLLMKLCKPEASIFNFIGKHSLFIYMLHQPVVYLILLIIFR